MIYEPAEKAARHVVEASPAPLPFPGRLDSLPNAPGVILLADDIDEVLYVVWGESIRRLVERAAQVSVASSASRLRWFRTNSLGEAKIVGKSFVKKYKPTGNQDDSATRIGWSEGIGGNAMTS